LSSSFIAQAGQARRASIDVGLGASAGVAAGLRLLASIIGLDGTLHSFNIEQVINQE
jgi:hypothetical protein